MGECDPKSLLVLTVLVTLYILSKRNPTGKGPSEYC